MTSSESNAKKKAWNHDECLKKDGIHVKGEKKFSKWDIFEVKARYC